MGCDSDRKNDTPVKPQVEKTVKGFHRVRLQYTYSVGERLRKYDVDDTYMGEQVLADSSDCCSKRALDVVVECLM